MGAGEHKLVIEKPPDEFRIHKIIDGSVGDCGECAAAIGAFQAPSCELGQKGNLPFLMFSIIMLRFCNPVEEYHCGDYRQSVENKLDRGNIPEYNKQLGSQKPE